MKSATASILVSFTFLVLTPIIGGATTVVLPDGSKVVVPSLETSDYESSFKTAHAVFNDAFARCGNNCSTGMLSAVAEYLSMVCPVSTNNFTRESLEALKKDDQLIREGKIPRSPVLLKRRTSPNVSDVARRHRLLVEWNSSVVDGRRQLLVLASETLKGYVKKLDRADRRPYVEWFVKKAKLNSEEEKIILMCAGCREEATSVRQEQTNSSANRKSDEGVLTIEQEMSKMPQSVK